MTLICGLDEAGRGPLAGPVSAACVILPEDFPFEILNDSKKLSEKKRNHAFDIIKEKACWGHSFVDEKTIDKINILQASLLAMKNAWLMMKDKIPEWAEKNGITLDERPLDEQLSAIVDGNKCPDLSCAVRAEVKADGKYPQVMAASILAKVERDRLMCEYDKLYPEYGYASHKGYPTKAHVEICRKIGPSPIQRMCFDYNIK